MLSTCGRIRSSSLEALSVTERLFNPYQIADLLGLTLEEVAASAQKGDLSFQRMPDGSIRISERGLAEFLRKQGRLEW